MTGGGKLNPKKLKAKTANQQNYIDTVRNNAITFCTGPAGTGKTRIAVGLAVESLYENKVEKIIFSRPIVESKASRYSGLGYLPGTLYEKIHPYLVPLFDELKNCINKEEVDEIKKGKQGLVEVIPLELMRGRNFHSTFVVVDEAQNASKEQILMLLTRLGNNSTIVINGDPDQSDLPLDDRESLHYFINKLSNLSGVGICELGMEDIVRNPLIAKILERLR